MNKTYVGIDNGVTGSIGVITIKGVDKRSAFIETPVIKVRDYTIEVQYCHRIDWRNLLENIPKDSIVALERPLVNPRTFVSSKSALRAFEATLIVLEMKDLEFIFIDSKKWQREFIGSNIIGHDNLKDASKKIGIELFPNHKTLIEKHGDADGLLIAEYICRMQNR